MSNHSSRSDAHDQPNHSPEPAANAESQRQESGWVESVIDLGAGAVNTGKAVTNVALGLGGAAVKQTYHLLEHTTQGAGSTIALIGNLPLLKNPVVKRVVGVLRLDWLVGMSQNLDLKQAEEEVRQLQQQYPQESPNQIAHRLMVKKAIYASGIGFASSVLPGVAAALLAVDMAATTALQTEMVYQIAAAYGLDLEDPDRKGEVLAIFGLALGGSNALKAGLGFMRNVPLAGMMIGAGTNATMLYSLGYAACRFYEAKLKDNTDETAPETLTALQQESEIYLHTAMAQQIVMDQILVHMILASYSEKTWEDILPELKTLQLDPASLEAIAAHLKSPEPLGALLEQLNRDFAMPLLAQCHRIAASNGEVSGKEVEVLRAIAEKAGVDADSLRVG
jgi:uncharacterized protein (DUF697 family)